MSKDVMPIREFSSFDVGNHYVKLMEEGVSDMEVGKRLRIFVRAFGTMKAKAGVGDHITVISHCRVDCENEDMVASIYGELDDMEDDFD